EPDALCQGGRDGSGAGRQPAQARLPRLRRPLMQLPLDLIPNPQSLSPALVFVRHPKARRYIIRVADDGTVRVTVPRWGSKREASAFAAQQHAWIEKQRARAERERRERERRTANDDSVQTDDERREGERALIARAKKELPPRLIDLAARHGLTVSRVSIRNQRWRWGSCSRDGHICLNWRLV